MREFFGGVGDLGSGFRMWGTTPRLMLLGAVPALVVSVVWGALLLWLAGSLDGIAAGLTPSAARWEEPWRSGVRLVVGLAVLLVALAVAVLTFTAVVLTVGDPFYERISGAVERRLGEAPADRQERLLPGLARAAGDGIRLAAASAGVGLVVLLLGLIPVAGAPVAFAAGALLGGDLLATELTGVPFDARGIPLAERRRVLRTHRARSLGFGVATWLVFLIPFAAVVAMPAAVGGAAVLSRRLLTAAPAARTPAGSVVVEGGDGVS